MLHIFTHIYPSKCSCVLRSVFLSPPGGFCWGLISPELGTPDMQQIQSMFRELRPERAQLGMDETVLGKGVL